MSIKGESLTAFLSRPYQAFLFGEHHGEGEEHQQRYIRIIRAAARAKIPHVTMEAPPSDQFPIDRMTVGVRMKKLFGGSTKELEKALSQSIPSIPWTDFVAGLVEAHSTYRHIMKPHAVDVGYRPYAVTLLGELGRDLEVRSMPLTLESIKKYLDDMPDDDLKGYQIALSQPDLTRQKMLEDFLNALRNPLAVIEGLKSRLSDDAAVADKMLERVAGERFIAFYGEKHLLHYKAGSDGPLDIDEALRRKLGNDKVARIHISGDLKPDDNKKPEFVLGRDFRIHPYISEFSVPAERPKHRKRGVHPGQQTEP